MLQQHVAGGKFSLADTKAEREGYYSFEKKSLVPRNFATAQDNVKIAKVVAKPWPHGD